jgi:hypothetical protein
MDDNRFDAWAKVLGGSGSRRASFRLLVGAVVAGGLTRLGLADVAAACKKPGKKCDKNNECCNKRCKKGRCGCRKVGQTCQSFVDFNDCCGSGSMSCLGPFGDTRCCKGNDQNCRQTEDCCGDDVCEAALGGRKRCCRQEGEVCKLTAGSRTCCNGLVCDEQDTQRCVKLSIGT